MRAVVFFTLALLLAPCSLRAQRAAEVPRPHLPRQAVALLESLQGEGPEQARNAIPKIEGALAELDDQHSRFLLLRALFTFHAQAGNFEASYAVLRDAVEEGFYFSLRTGEQPYPPFLPEFEGFVGYEEMLAANESLRALDQERSVLEYFVSLPDGYDPERLYPLVIVLHGGGGNHAETALNWVSPRLKAGYIVAFVQGSRCYGSYTKSFFGGQSVEELGAAYEQLSGHYAVDPTQVLLAAESSGAIVALDLTFEEKIPVAGILLAFPHYPSEPENEKISAAAERGVRAVLLNGEHDWRLPRQKVLGVAFDQNGLPNRFIVYPGIGHGLPNDFATEIDRSLEFLAAGKGGRAVSASGVR